MQAEICWENTFDEKLVREFIRCHSLPAFFFVYENGAGYIFGPFLF